MNRKEMKANLKACKRAEDVFMVIHYFYLILFSLIRLLCHV